jgi:transcriptional regulator with XRE-family HTH domain
MPLSTTKRPAAVQSARNALRRKGWKQAEAARHLGVSAVHLNYVLNGRRESKRLLNAIARLPENHIPA